MIADFVVMCSRRFLICTEQDHSEFIAVQTVVQANIGCICPQNLRCLIQYLIAVASAEARIDAFEIIDTDEQKLFQNMNEVYRLLNRLKADDSNDRYDPALNMQLQRERWMKKLIGGMVSGEEELERQMLLYRFNARTDMPCVLARIEMSDEDGFMSVRWHYGSDRLETALRNFFGQEYSHMRIHLAVTSPEEVRVLCYPADEAITVSENLAYDYMKGTTEQIEHYLGLHMNILEVVRLSGLRELCGCN
jgi:hypothetical protein